MNHAKYYHSTCVRLRVEYDSYPTSIIQYIFLKGINHGIIRFSTIPSIL